ncbi:MAG TPA: hypothetical protein ENG13_01385 [bacterium]|nr:hypothetical protein [bacterium]HEX67703.1 hypothetical protein [bacterium]
MEKKCPAATVYNYIHISKRTKKKGVKCLFQGIIHDQETIELYCLGIYTACPVYRKYKASIEGGKRDKENEAIEEAGKK